MLRRLSPASRVSGGALFAAHQQQGRNYRILPHIDTEIEELAETQSRGRWFLSHITSYQEPQRQSELMCDKLNLRERRRNGTLPEKSICRAMSNLWAKDGVLQQPDEASRTKWIKFTVVGFDGHPYHFRLYPMIDMSLNNLIDSTGMNHGWRTMWNRCNNHECADQYHGDGCLINVDLDTLDKLPPPSRFEYMALTHHRMHNRADVRFTARFSCQIKVIEDLDGGLFAMKQYFSRSLREMAGDWGETDIYATAACHKQKKIEPWAPMLEEPTKKDFPITWDLIWARDYESVLKQKYPSYRRKDGFHTKPEMWDTHI